MQTLSVLPDIDEYGAVTRHVTPSASIYPHYAIQVLDEDEPPQSVFGASMTMPKPLPALQNYFKVEDQTTSTPLNDLVDAPTPILDVWNQAAKERKDDTHGDQTLSWDKLGEQATTEQSPFLSEQPEAVIRAYQRQILSSKGFDTHNWPEIDARHFYAALITAAHGNSSELYIWDSGADEFSIRGRKEPFTVPGLDVETVASISKRFLRIGQLLRRLEVLVSSFRLRKNNISTVVYALGEILVYVHNKGLSVAESMPLMALWTGYADVEHLLTVLGELFYRDPSHASPYPPIPSSLTTLTSRIYHCLSSHVSSHSPHIVRASLAYLLSIATEGIMTGVGRDIGLLSNDQASDPNTHTPLTSKPFSNESFMMLEPLDTEDISLPDFIPKDVISTITKAKRSLHALQNAKPDHPLCKPKRHWANLLKGWRWTETETNDIKQALSAHVRDIKSSLDVRRQEESPEGEHQQGGANVPLTLFSSSSDPFSQFRLFDLEPGLHMPEAVQPSALSSFHDFIISFPSSLPPSSPTLPTLLAVTISEPLLTHSRLLSSALIDLFLGELSLMGHLSILRSFFLFGDSSFVERLRNALFVDSTDPRQTFLSHSLSRSTHDRKASTARWGVGLNPEISERKTWPPDASRLAYALRAVIVDALDKRREPQVRIGSRRKTSSDDILREAEWRLGFAINAGVTVDEQNAIWADSSSIAAFDFLQMQYNLPKSISMFITSEVMDKYKRVFRFLLSLLRVDSVAGLLYRATHHKNPFPNFPASQHQFQIFRFQINVFVQSLLRYIFDKAIGATYELFIQRLIKLQHGVAERHQLSRSSLERSTQASPYEDASTPLVDIFAIQTYHSSVMDQILEACLLKAKHQRIVGMHLGNCMDLVLSVGGLILTDLGLGGDGEGVKVEEDRAARKLGRMYESWVKSMGLLISGLTELSETGSSARLRPTPRSRRSNTKDAKDDAEAHIKANALLSIVGRDAKRTREVSGFADLLLRLSEAGTVEL